MKKLGGILCSVSLILLVGCANVTVPFTEVARVNVKEVGSREGTASCTGILGILYTGDCSIATAARNGGIKEIKTVDRHVDSFLWPLFRKDTIIVTGE